MNKLYIVCIDDQPEVLTALEQDLSYFEKQLNKKNAEAPWLVLYGGSNNTFKCF